MNTNLIKLNYMININIIDEKKNINLKYLIIRI